MPRPPSAGRGAICLAVYRPDGPLLERQVRSIADQTLRSWTCIVAIDGHDEQAKVAVREAAAGDERFRILSYEDNVGFYRNFERCLGSAMALDPSWIALADQDDYWYPTKLEQQALALKSSPEVTLSLGAALLTDGRGEVVGKAVRRTGPLFDSIVDNQVTGSFSVFAPQVARLALPFPDPTAVAYHDHWIGVCAAVTGSIRVETEPLQEYVQHGSNVIGEPGATSFSTRVRALGILTPWHVLRVVRDERWAWRVRVARSVLDRVDRLATADRRDLESIARARPSLHLMRSFVGTIRRGGADRWRALALMMGAVLTWRSR